MLLASFQDMLNYICLHSDRNDFLQSFPPLFSFQKTTNCVYSSHCFQRWRWSQQVILRVKRRPSRVDTFKHTFRVTCKYLTQLTRLVLDPKCRAYKNYTINLSGERINVKYGEQVYIQHTRQISRQPRSRRRLGRTTPPLCSHREISLKEKKLFLSKAIRPLLAIFCMLLYLFNFCKI